MTPSTSIGVDSCPRRVSKSANQARPSCPTLSAVINFSGLNRCSLYVRPVDSQSLPSFSDALRRALSTAAYLPMGPEPATAGCAPEVPLVTEFVWWHAVIIAAQPNTQTTHRRFIGFPSLSQFSRSAADTRLPLPFAHCALAAGCRPRV